MSGIGQWVQLLAKSARLKGAVDMGNSEGMLLTYEASVLEKGASEDVPASLGFKPMAEKQTFTNA